MGKKTEGLKKTKKNCFAESRRRLILSYANPKTQAAGAKNPESSNEPE